MRECRENLINGQLLWHFPSMHVDFLGLGREDPPRLSLRRTSLEAFCPPRSNPACGHSSDKYRTHDGTCNNRLRPHWGASQMPYQRFLTPDYDDGISTPRRATDGSPLPSARFVSLVIVGANREESPVTLMLAQWGQFIDHDTTATRQPMSVNGSIPSCCGSSTENNPNCFPIKVPFDDPWLVPIGIRCLEFLRSAPTQRRDCTLSWREQTNQVTSFIDASTVYGSTQRQTQNIRLFQNGLLLFGRGSPKEDVCLRAALASRCVRSGDARSNEQPALLALHIIWVQEHNRIAMELGNLNHHWSDEKIYQETRRIIIAMMQHITYREFLPLVLGRVVCQIFGLNLQESGYYKGYNENTNPTTANSYAAAAFRFGHSLIQDTIMRADRHNFFLPNNVSLHEEDQRGDIGGPGSLPRIIRGNIKQRSMKVDEFVTPELTNHLFQNPNARFGLDLAAINIQRGRDHGLPVYTSWRVACGLTAINDWKDLHDVMGSGTVRRLRQAYRSVHDIDVWVGGISERPVVGGLVGPVIACIVAQQFVNFRRGDRFWYENGGFDSSFTPAQLAAIRKTNLAQVLCRSSGGGQMQPFVFLMPEMTGNEYQTCGTKSLTPIDLSPWKEIDPFRHDEEHLNLFDIPATHIMINPFKDDNFVSSKVEHISDNNTKLTTEQTINSKLDLTNITTETNQNVTVSDKLDKPKKTLVAIKRLRKPTKPKKKRPHHRRVDDLLFKNEDNATVYVGNKPLTVDEGGEKSIRDFLLSLTPRPFQIEINIKRTESTKAPPDMTTSTYALRPEVRPTYTTTHKPFGNFDKDKESFISLPQTGSSPFSYDSTTKPHREDENLLHTDVDPGPIFTTYRPNLQTSFHLGGPKKTTTTTTTETVYIVPPNADKDPTSDYQPIQSSPSPNLSPFSTSDSSIFWAKNLSPLLDLDSPVKTKPSVDSKLSSDDFKPPNTYDFDEDYDFTTLPPALNSDLNENDDISPDKIPFDEDGYLRPEHIHLNHTMNDDHIEIIQLEGEELTQNSGKDDFVLPIFSQDFKTIDVSKKKKLVFTDTLARTPDSDIMAEDSDEVKDKTLTDADTPLLPLVVLTRVDRPDNWAFFDAPKNKNLPPKMPSFEDKSVKYSKELPKPIQFFEEIIKNHG